MNFEIIDFHTHPFTGKNNNICMYYDNCDITKETTVDYLKGMGITRIAGSVITWEDTLDKDMSVWDKIILNNNTALELADFYNGFYIPGFHVHPDYVKESCEEIERMNKKGVKLIGELVPYHDGDWSYSCKGFDEILDVAKQYGMIVNFHTDNNDAIDEMVRKHPDVTFVGAHPGEKDYFLRHLERMRMSENYHLDLSGTGLFRHAMLRYGIDMYGKERFLFGSDYPVCNPAVYVGGVIYDSLLTDEEKEYVLSKNAKRLLGL